MSDANRQSGGGVGDWTAAIEAMKGEWREVCRRKQRRRGEALRRKIERWGVEFRKIKEEYQELVARGAWQRGDEDVLSILGCERREVYHSAMVAWLFDPLAPHGFGTEFVAAFLQRADPTWNVNPRDCADVRVVCEEAVGDCRADVVVRTGCFTLVVESKIDAGEGERQCDRLYEAFVEEHEDVRFVFLTPSGRRPRTATGEASEAFRRVSYRQLRRCLKELIERSTDGEQSRGRASAENYLMTLEREFP